MVPSRERTEYMYELRNIAENIVRERLEHLDLHPPVHTRPETFQCGEMQEVEHANSGNVGSAEAPLDEQTRSHSLGPAMDCTCWLASHAGISQSDDPRQVPRRLAQPNGF